MTGMSSRASMDTTSMLRDVITASAPAARARNASRRTSSGVGKSGRGITAVRNSSSLPARTASTLRELPMTRSMPAAAAASASSAVLAVTWVDTCRPLPARRSARVTMRRAGRAAQVYVRFMTAPGDSRESCYPDLRMARSGGSWLPGRGGFRRAVRRRLRHAPPDWSRSVEGRAIGVDYRYIFPCKWPNLAVFGNKEV